MIIKEAQLFFFVNNQLVMQSDNTNPLWYNRYLLRPNYVQFDITC